MAEEVKTFRDRLAEALGEHTPHVGWGAGKWSAECLNTECRYFTSGNGGVRHATAAFNAHVAERLTASEPLRSLLAENEALRAKLRDMEIERNMLRSTLAEVPERLVAERDHPSRAWNNPTARGERDMLWGDWFREGMDTAINTIRADDALGGDR